MLNKDSASVRPIPLLSLADRIREARKRAGLTKAELARRVGVCLSAAVQWEHPQGTAPNMLNLIRVAQLTDVAFEWLTTGRGPTRIAVEGKIPTIDPAVMAATLFEERLLLIARQLPSEHCEPLLEFLASFIKKPKAQRD